MRESDGNETNSLETTPEGPRARSRPSSIRTVNDSDASTNTSKLKRERPPTLQGSIDIHGRREYVRELLAKRLVWVLGLTILAGFLLVATITWTKLNEEDIRSFFGMVFTAIVALVSSVVGYYFGSERLAQGAPDVDRRN
jgi:hypothetical protein